MNALELKKMLIHRIAEIDDISFLNAIKTILDTKAKILTLTPEQKFEITESQKEIKKGLYMDQNELDKEFDKWLNGK